MVSRRDGELKRSVLSALAALVAALVPSLVALPAMADPASGRTAEREEQGKAPKHPKRDKKAHAVKGQKPHGKQDVKAEKQDTSRKRDEAKVLSSAKPQQGSLPLGKGKKTKKTASRSASSREKKVAKKADSDAPHARCFGPKVTVDRGGLEGETFSLVDCHGAPLAASRTALSLLARPWSVPRPAHVIHEAPAPSVTRRARRSGVTSGAGRESASAVTVASAKAASAGEIAPGVRLLDPGLLTRLEAVSQSFPGKPISLVSGYRPRSQGSQHQAGRALDLRVAGVSNEDLVAFCKTLTDTGCGYYPNSSFVHIDVRNPGTGVVTWIDASGPGEAPRYVRQWPPPEEPLAKPSGAPSTPDGEEPHDSASDPWKLDLDAIDGSDAESDSAAPAAKSSSSETSRALLKDSGGEQPAKEAPELSRPSD